MTTANVLASNVATQNPVRRRPLRSIGAVVGGLLAGAIVTTAVDTALHTLGVYPPVGIRMSDGLFLIAMAYRILFNIGGCYLAARLAPARPLRHAVAVGIIGTVIATAGAAAMWSLGPAWYSLANIVLAIPCAWVGGKLVRR